MKLSSQRVRTIIIFAVVGIVLESHVSTNPDQKSCVNIRMGKAMGRPTRVNLMTIFEALRWSWTWLRRYHLEET